MLKRIPPQAIIDIFTLHTNYKVFTKLDIAMQYYTFDMDEESRNLCTITTPFRLYCYCQLHMGVSEAPDISTEIMHNIFSDMDDLQFYMDDIGCFSNSWKEQVR